MGKKIYLGHATGFDYQAILYRPIKASELWVKHEIYLPHDSDAKPGNSKKRIAQADLFIAEVSYPSTGLGIELGWAEAAGIPIICLHQEDKSYSSSLPLICRDFIAYKSSQDMIEKLRFFLSLT